MISVLYVDDEPDLLELARIFLEDTQEFRVETETAATAALKNPSFASFDAIVSDFQMPGMDGIAFLQEVRKRFGDIPFILFTGRGREEVAIEALNNGADFYLQKGGEPTAQFAELGNKIRYAVARKRAERALAESEERYRSVVNDQSEMIARFTPDGVLTFTNTAFKTHFATFFNQGDIEGRNIRDLTAPEKYPEVEAFIASLTREAPVREVERCLTARDGSRLWQHWSVRALFRDGDRPAEYQAVGWDTTRVKLAEDLLKQKNDELNASYEQIAADEEELRAQLDELTGKQEALRTSEERFRAFTENIPDLTTIVGPEGTYTYISPSVLRITGWQGDRLLGRKFREIDAVFGIVQEDKESLLESGRLALQHPGTTVTVPPFRVRDAAGALLFIEGSFTYLPDVKGIEGYLVHGRDVTVRVQAEEEIKQKN